METTARTIEATKALARLEQEPLGWERRVVWAIARYRPRAGAPPSPLGTPYRDGAPTSEAGMVASRGLREKAAALGYRHLGGYEYLTYFFEYCPRDAYVSEDGLVCLSLRRNAARGVEAKMSPYILSTVLDDGTTIVTWGKPTAGVPSSPRFESRPGTGRLAQDHDDHVAAVRARLDETAHETVRVVEVSSISEMNALSRYSDAYLSPDSIVDILVTRRFMFFAVALLLVALAARALWGLLVRA